MGDRGNIVVKQGEGQFIHVYTHWCGSELPKVLRSVIAAGDSLDDAPYLTHLIVVAVSKMAGGESVGVSCSPMDNERDVLLVDVDAQQVTLWSDDAYGRKDWPQNGSTWLASWTFEEFARSKD